LWLINGTRFKERNRREGAKGSTERGRGGVRRRSVGKGLCMRDRRSAFFGGKERTRVDHGHIGKGGRGHAGRTRGGERGRRRRSSGERGMGGGEEGHGGVKWRRARRRSLRGLLEFFGRSDRNIPIFSFHGLGRGH